MYCSFFGLRRRPFDDHPDPDFFHPTSKHEEVLAAMEYDVHHGSGVTMVLGEAGTGKTLLIRALQRRFDKGQTVAVLTCPIGSGFDFLGTIAQHFGIKKPSSSRSSQLVARIRRGLQKRASSEHPAVLLVDQAEQLGHRGMRNLAALSELDNRQDRLLQIFIVGQPRLKSLLDRPELESIRQRAVDVRTVSTLTPSDTREYIRSRLKAGGADDVDFFEDEAARLVHEASGGIPRIINRVCDGALVSAYGAGCRQVTPAIIREVAAGILENKSTGADVSTETPEDKDHATAGESLAGRRCHSDPPREPAPVCEPVTQPPTCGTGPQAGQSEGSEWERGYDIASNAASPTVFAGASAPTSDLVDVDWELRDRSEALMRSVEGSIGRGIAHLQRQESVSTSIEALTGNAEALLERMERTIHRAEHLEAARARREAARDDGEQRIDEKLRRAEELSEKFSRAMERMDEMIRQADARVESSVRQYDEQISSLEDRLSTPVAESEHIAERLEQMDQAVRSARDIEERLAAFGERLLESGENAQEKISVLMKELTSGEEVLVRLETTNRQADEAADRCGATVMAHSKAAEETITRCDESAAQLSTDTETALRRADEIKQRFAEDSTRHKVLSGKYERLTEQVDSLVTKTDTLPDSIAAAESRIDELTARCDATIESHTQAVDQTAHACEQSIAKLGAAANEALGTSAEVERRLADLGERQAAVTEELSRDKESIDATQSNLRRLTEAVDQVESKVEELDLGAAQTTAQLDDLVKSVEWKVTDFQSRAQEVVSDVATSVKRGESHVAQVREAVGQAQNVHDTVANCLINIGSACERVDAAKEEIATLSGSLSQVSQSQSRCDEMAERFGTMLAESQGLETLLARVEQAKRFAREVKAIVDGLAETRDDANVAQAALSERIAEAQQRGEHICRRLCDATTEASEGLHQAEKIGPTIDEAKQLHEMMSIDLNQAGQKIETLGSHVAAASDVVRTLADATRQGHNIVERVTVTCERVDQAENLAERITGAGEYCDRLTDLLAAARKDFEQFEALRDAATTERDEASRRLEEDSSAARKYGKQFMRLLSTIQEVSEKAQSQCTELTRLTQAGEPLVDRFETTTTVAEEKSSALRAQLEAAEKTSMQHQDVVRRLEENASAAHEVGEQVERLVSTAKNVGTAAESHCGKLAELTEASKPVLDRLEKSVGTLVSDIGKLSNSAQTRAEQLLAAGETTEPLAQSLDKTIADAGQLAGRLEVRIDEAAAGTETLRAQCARAVDAGDKLKSVVKVLRVARTVNKALSDSVEQANSARESADQAAEEAISCTAALREEHASARQTLETQVKTRKETESAHEQISRLYTGGRDLVKNLRELQTYNEGIIAELDQRLESGSGLVGRADEILHRVDQRDNSIQAGERMLREFVTQAEDLSERLKSLQTGVGGLERTVSDIMTEPATIIDDAKTQATQLEGVCRAVRKVFAGLSKTSLEANQKTTEFAQISHNADERMQRLLTETELACGTLQEWVEEAIRAQTRLAKTIGQSPTVADTHPVENLQSIARSLRPLAPSGGVESGGLTMPARPKADQQQPQAKTITPPTQADEIANLINDAKRAAHKAPPPSPQTQRQGAGV